MSIPLTHSFTALVCGPSRCGKSVFVSNLLRFQNEMISPVPQVIIYCYSEWQSLFDDLQKEIPEIRFHEGLVDINTLDSSIRHLLIYDDMMEQCNEDIAMTYTKFSHHRNLSIIFILQNIYHKNQHIRTMNLNSSYLVLFKNPRDINQIRHLSTQMYPRGKTGFLVQSFEDATSIPHGYLFIDLKQETPDLLRIRTGIFPNEKCYIYMPTNTTSSLVNYTLNSDDGDV